MGIYDREYYRRPAPGFFGSLSGQGGVVRALLIANGVAFLIQILTAQPFYNNPGWFYDAFVLDADAVVHGQVWRLLSYSFLHSTASWTHIVFNMLFLWFFGRDLEELYGSREFLIFYLLAAFLGGLAFVGMWGLQAPAQYCIGASGAVTAVLVLYALHYPRQVIYIWGILPVPIWLFVGVQVAQDTFFFLNPGMATRTAVSVHLAGAAFALVYYSGQLRFSGFFARFKGWQKERARPRLRVYREETQEPVSVGAPQASNVDEQLEAKLDAVLEKVAQHGQNSLTDVERQILFRASEIYKRRRS